MEPRSDISTNHIYSIECALCRVDICKHERKNTVHDVVFYVYWGRDRLCRMKDIERYLNAETVHCWQNRLWWLFSRHTTMTLIIIYLVYSQVSTSVS